MTTNTLALTVLVSDSKVTFEFDLHDMNDRKYREKLAAEIMAWEDRCLVRVHGNVHLLLPTDSLPGPGNGNGCWPGSSNMADYLSDVERCRSESVEAEAVKAAVLIEALTAAVTQHLPREPTTPEEFGWAFAASQSRG